MANNPIYENTLRHWLNFKSPNYGRVEITEPINFDSFSFKIKQRTNGFGRDKEIGAEEIDLEFVSNAYGSKIDVPQTLIGGVLAYHLSHRLDLIFEAVREKGSESVIEYIVSNKNVDFVMGLFDVPESTTDGYSYFNCSVVQNTNKALIERKKDIKADVFALTDTFSNPQVPLEKTKVLLKSKPIKQKTNWNKIPIIYLGESRNKYPAGSGFRYVNFNQAITEAQILDSYTAFDPTYFDFSGVLSDGLKVISPAGSVDFTNVNITISDIDMKMVHIYNGRTGFTNRTSCRWLWIVTDGNGNLIDSEDMYFVELLGTSTQIAVLPETITGSRPALENGQVLSIVFEFTWTSSTISLDPLDYSTIDEYSHIEWNSSKQDITVTSNSVDSVIDAVPYYDFLKKGIKSVSRLEFECPDIESGLFKNQYILNGNLIRQKDDISLNFVFKDEMNDLQEVLMDYQIFDDKVGAYQYPEFYNNTDLGSFLQIPDIKFERTFNDRFKKIRLEYGYKTFEQDRNEENTVDAFHTEAQFLFPNLQVDDELKVDINHIRDPFTIESARREAINSSTALTTDDKIFIIDCVELPEGSTNSFTRSLLMQASDPYILKIKSNGFKWTLLGLNNGDAVSITYGENQGNYHVLQHDDDILELTRDDDTLPPFSGQSVITFNYPLTGVTWVNRTNEDFNIIENLESPDKCSNLKYTIKRNLTRDSWSSYLATICKDVPDGIIKCTDFKVNGELTTQFQDGEIITEKEDIQVSNLKPKILDKYEYKTTVAIGFEQAKKLIEDMVNVRGYIRIYDTKNRVIKIHPKLLDMSWADGIMEITGESRNESDTINIVSVAGGVSIYQNGYDEIIDTSLEWFKIDNGYVQIFDNKQIPLINPTIFTNIMINGNLYTDDVSFYKTLDNL